MVKMAEYSAIDDLERKIKFMISLRDWIAEHRRLDERIALKDILGVMIVMATELKKLMEIINVDVDNELWSNDNKV